MKQATALNILKAGKNVFLTGSAGAGKTYTLQQYIRYLRARKVPVAVTASTGIAATHANGVTIHTWAGIGIKDFLNDSDLAKMKERKYLREHMENAQVLIIDEVSMLHARQLDMVNQVLQYFKENDLPFGGIQVVFSGDFFQLPPVGNPSETNREKFAFMSKAWLQADLVICYLEEQFRQTDNSSLSDILNEIRAGAVSEASVERLKATKDNTFLHQLTAPKLYTHNADVDAINQQHLSALQSAAQCFEAEEKGGGKLMELLKNGVRTDAQLSLKKGAKVMFIKNNFERGYINGSLGEVVGFEQTDEQGILPKVRLRNGQEIIAEPETWSIDDEGGKSLASFRQVPLRLAWAITIHKSQGMTLDAAEMDLTHTFERGQGYVALSRLRTLEGLRLLGINRTALELDPLAMKADKRFKELSQEAANRWSDEELQALHKAFVLSCGGIIDEKEIKKRLKKMGEITTTQPTEDKEKSKKAAKTKASKGDTYQETKILIEQGLSLAEIADEKGCAVGTVVAHLSKLFRSYPDMDFTRFKPDTAIIKKVERALREMTETDLERTEDGSIRLRPLYEYLKETVSYDDIRLALFFIGD